MKPIFYFLLILMCCACGTRSKPKNPERVVKDALQREVHLPDTIRRVICVRASAIRLVTYAGGAPLICGVEEQETRANAFTHAFANPALCEKPIIGPGMGGDPELILSAHPDVIFMSSTTAGDADDLQRRVGIPVFAIEYGDMGRNRSTFYQSLRQIGSVLHTERKVDSLIRYVNGQIAELQQRTADQEKPSKVYVGGISYKGQKGITSTDPYYAAFEFLGVNNAASSIDPAYVSPITGTYIDWEQLMDWNPDVIFVDMDGWQLVEEDFRTRQGLNQQLKAYRNKRIYSLWPYNNHHTNFEVMLANAWYAGKALFPEQFADVSIEEKTNEIMTRFVGAPIYQKLSNHWGEYRNISN